MLKAIIATLVLGSASIAAADVTSSTIYRNDRHDTRYDHRYDRDQSRFDRRYRPSWVALSSPLQLDRRWNSIDVNQRGTFTQLRLQSTSGMSKIDKVIVQFQNGQRQVVELDARLSPRNPMINVALEGNRRIDRVIVMGDSRRNGAIQVFAI